LVVNELLPALLFLAEATTHEVVGLLLAGVHDGHLRLHAGVGALEIPYLDRELLHGSFVQWIVPQQPIKIVLTATNCHTLATTHSLHLVAITVVTKDKCNHKRSNA
jgi:hypothetical protein